MPIRLRLVATFALLCCSCATVQGTYVWVQDYADDGQGGAYTIAPGDVLQIRVFNQEAVSARTRVRRDGKISVPLLNDVDAVGFAPSVLAAQLQTRLKDFIKLPAVTVSVEEPAQVKVSVVGEVVRPGVFPLDARAGVLEALALSGGLTEFAHKDRLFVVRPGPHPARVRFTWDALARADPAAVGFSLRTGDVVVVE